MNNLTGFDFTEEDLRANQRGVITPRQKEWVQGWAQGIRRSQNGNFPLVIFFMLLGFGMFFGMTFSNESARRAFLADPLNLVIVCAAVPVILGIMGLSRWMGKRRADRLENSGLKVAEGVISLDEETSRVGTTYYVYVGETELKFGEDMSAVFPQGARFRVYYCETSFLQMILSYERLG